MILRRFFALSLCFGIAGFVGCGSGRKYEAKSFPVEGRIQYKDGPDASDLGGGTLELESSGTVLKVPINTDGTFTQEEKLPEGKYRVRIVAPPPPPDAEYQMDARFKEFASSGVTVTIGAETPQRPTITLTRTRRANRD